MARTAKRKSESAVPTGRGKQRKTSDPVTWNLDSDRSADGGSSDNMFVDEQPVAPKYVKKSAGKRKSEPVKRVTKVDEYEEDEGRYESQQFLAMIKFESKKKRKAAKASTYYMKRFNESVSDEQEKLRHHREDLSAAAEKLDKNFLEAFTNCYAASRPLPAPPSEVSRGKVPLSKVAFSTLYDHSKNFTANAFRLVGMFEKANEITTKIDVAKLMDTNWEQECYTVEKVLEAGHTAGLQKYEALTEGVVVPDVDEDMIIFAEAIYLPANDIETLGYGKMARKQVKAIKKLDKIRSEVAV